MTWCDHCSAKGDFERCQATDCAVHTSWHAERLRAEPAEAQYARKKITMKSEFGCIVLILAFILAVCVGHVWCVRSLVYAVLASPVVHGITRMQVVGVGKTKIAAEFDASKNAWRISKNYRTVDRSTSGGGEAWTCVLTIEFRSSERRIDNGDSLFQVDNGR